MKYTSLINKRVSLFSKWLLPYVIILLIPILINSYAFNSVKDILHKQTVSSNTLVLNQTKQDTDGVFSQVRQVFVQLYFLDIFESSDNLTSYDIHKATNHLKNISSSYPDISQIILYNSSSDYVITSNNAVNSKSYYESYNPFHNSSYKDFLEILTGKYSGNFQEYEMLSFDGSSQNALVFQKTMNNINKISNSYNVFIVVQNNTLFHNISSSDSMSNGLFVMIDNAKNQTVTTYGNHDLEQYIPDILENAKPNSEVVLSSTNSDMFDLKYCMLMTESNVWKEENRIQSMFLISILICILFGAVVIITSKKTNYNPLKNLAEMLQLKSNQNQSADNMQAIYTGIHDIMEQYSSIMSSQNAGLKATFLQRFIRGREEGQQLDDQFKTYGMHFVSNRFAVSLIYIEDFTEFFIGAETMSKDQKYRFAHLTITNIFEELCVNICIPYYVDMDDTIAYIINFKQDGEDKLTSILLEMQEFVKQHFSIHTSIAISDVFESPQNIPLAYNQALDTLEYKEVIGIETVIHHNQIVHINSQNFYYPLDMEQQLLNCVKSGEYENAQNILDTIYKINFDKQSMTLNTARCLLSNMISTMIKALNSKIGAIDEAFEDGEDFIAKLFECKTIEEHKQLLSEMLKRICEYNKDTTIDSNLVSKIIDYVQNNYQDINLNVAAVAMQLGFHPTYISNMFKKQTGQGLLDFIKEVRIEVAKQLLKSEDNTIEAISSKCGFANSKTFTRTFKSATGLTPGKYNTISNLKC